MTSIVMNLWNTAAATLFHRPKLIQISAQSTEKEVKYLQQNSFWICFFFLRIYLSISSGSKDLSLLQAETGFMVMYVFL